MIKFEYFFSGWAVVINLDLLWRYSKDLFYISRFPSKILLSDVVSIVLGAFILVIIAAIYPAKRAGKVNISEVLRHE